MTCGELLVLFCRWVPQCDAWQFCCWINGEKCNKTVIRNREPLTASGCRMQKLLHFHTSSLLAPVCLIFFYSRLWCFILFSFHQIFQLLRQERLPWSCCCCQEKYFLSLHHLLKWQQKIPFSPLTSLSLYYVFSFAVTKERTLQHIVGEVWVEDILPNKMKLMMKLGEGCCQQSTLPAPSPASFWRDVEL